ncbi:hypothetical protein Droror1_Dr00023113 [Drosera rotundifolia]
MQCRRVLMVRCHLRLRIYPIKEEYTWFDCVDVMALKRQFDDERSDDDARLPGEEGLYRPKLRQIVKYVMKETIMQELVARIAPAVREAVREELRKELEPIRLLLQSSSRSAFLDQPDPSVSRPLQLQFVHDLPDTLFTNSRIESLGNLPIQIELIDANTKSRITDASFGSIKFEAVVLTGDFAGSGNDYWTEKEFSDSIVREREGKRPLLVGDISVTPVNGVATLNNISFTDNSSWVRSRKFKLGIRAVPTASQGVGIKEAIAGPLVVLDHRGESYQKHHTPALDDPVWRLRKIAKGGAFHKRLNERGINTVKEFLQRYHTDTQSLREILGNNVPNKAWEAITGHANACQLDNQQLYAYMNAEGLGLKFNCVYKVVAVTFDGQNYIPVESLDVYQRSRVEELKRDAYQNLNELVPVNNTTTPCFSLPSSIRQMPPYSFPALCLEPNGVPVTDQGRINFGHGELSAIFTHLNDDVIHPCESSAFPARGSQPMRTVSAAISALAMQDSPMNVLGGAFEWTPISTSGASPLDNFFFDDEIDPFQVSSLPAATSGNWDQGTDLFTVVGLGRHMTAVDMSGSGSPRARWCKLRAAIKWKIAKRSAATKRKGKLPFYYSY